MKIGELSRATGTNIETIRYYERIGLLPAPARTDANYRSYGDAHRARLRFVRHSRELGFTIDEIRSLLDLSDHPERDCADADRIASAHLEQVEEKIAQLSALRDELTRIVGRCRGGLAGDCRVRRPGRRLPRDRGAGRPWAVRQSALTDLGSDFGIGFWERWDDSVARLVPSRWYPILLPGSVRTAFYLSNLRP